MAVIVIVIVIVPVVVAALVNGNEAVIVIDAVDIEIDQLGERRHNAFEQLNPSRVKLGVGQLVYRITSRCEADSIAERLAIA